MPEKANNVTEAVLQELQKKKKNVQVIQVINADTSLQSPSKSKSHSYFSSFLKFAWSSIPSLP